MSGGGCSEEVSRVFSNTIRCGSPHFVSVKNLKDKLHSHLQLKTIFHSEPPIIRQQVYFQNPY